MKRLSLLMLALAFVPALAACRGNPTQTPAPTPTPAAAAGAPMLTVIAPVVEFREKEMGEGEELAADASVEVEPGANILTREGGQANLAWEGFLGQEMLTDTDTLLGLSQPEKRYVVLDQATGTARYTLEGPGEPATLTIKAGWIDINVKEGAAQFIVSLVPGTQPSAWLSVLEGSADVDRQGETISLSAGQAAGFTADGPLPDPMEVDSALIKTWFGAVADGTATTSIVAVAFRCEVTAATADLLVDPQAGATAAGAPLKKGTVVEVAQRDEDGQWLRVKPLGKLEIGWAETKNLACSGPISSVSTTLPGEIGLPTATLARPTRGVQPTRPAPTVGGPTATPTATPTPTASVSEISLSVDDDELEKGECTTLRWTVKNVKEYYVNGSGKAGDTGSEKVCPSKTTTYTLRAVLPDGSEQSRSVTVEVNQPQPTTVPPTNPPPVDTPVPPADTPVPPVDTPVPPVDTPVPPFASDTPPPPLVP